MLSVSSAVSRDALDALDRHLKTPTPTRHTHTHTHTNGRTNARQQEAIEVNKVLSTPKPVLEAMARSISPEIYKSFTARYTKDIALEVGTGCCCR